MDQLVASTQAYLEAAEAEPTMEGYTVRFLSPVYSADTSRGVFWWVGVAPSLAALGAANDYWGTEANAEHSNRFGELTDDCESSSAHYLTPVATDDE
jgi:acyl dehydratase